jgi:predicted secreted protein
LAEVNVDTADNIIRPMPMMHAMAMDARMEKSAAPNAAPGETDITLTVTAKVLLK